MSAPLARRAPTAKLAAALLLPILLLFSLDPVVPAVALAGELLAVPFFGVSYRALARRCVPLLISAAALMITFAFFAGERTGATLLALGPAVVTTGTLATSGALALRLFAIALPGIIVFLTTDPTDLADSLSQHARVSPRFAIGALAAFRLVGLMQEEWRTITYARRARGVEARNPVAALRMFTGTAFILLVGAIRRGVRLSLAMDARGFDAGHRRGIARPSSFGPADWLLIAGSAALGALALWAGTR